VYNPTTLSAVNYNRSLAMSHFTVLVIGDDHEKQLAPFHEFECTGEVDEHVQSIDQTDEAWETYARDTTKKVRAPDGEVYGAYDDRFYRDPTPEESDRIGFGGTGFIGGKDGKPGFSYTSRDWEDGKGYRSKVRDVPVEWEEFNEDTSKEQSFAEFVADYYGYTIANNEDEIDLNGDHKFGYVLMSEAGDVAKVVNRTNPNSHWDWYQVGGRWTGFFKLKEGADGDVGSPSLVSTRRAEAGSADQARKGDIDFEGMRDAAEEKAGQFYDDFADLFDKDTVFLNWDEVRERHVAAGTGIDGAREEFGNHPTMVAIRERAKEKDHSTWGLDPRDSFCNGDRAAVLARARMTAISTFAVVYKGKWYEKGDMGWWGVVSDVKDVKKWEEEFAKLIDDADDDTQFTLVDCHT
jgi:hypothetical protein